MPLDGVTACRIDLPNGLCLQLVGHAFPGPWGEPAVTNPPSIAGPLGFEEGRGKRTKIVRPSYAVESDSIHQVVPSGETRDLTLVGVCPL